MMDMAGSDLLTPGTAYDQRESPNKALKPRHSFAPSESPADLEELVSPAAALLTSPH